MYHRFTRSRFSKFNEKIHLLAVICRGTDSTQRNTDGSVYDRKMSLTALIKTAINADMQGNNLFSGRRKFFHYLHWKSSKVSSFVKWFLRLHYFIFCSIVIDWKMVWRFRRCTNCFKPRNLNNSLRQKIEFSNYFLAIISNQE